MNEYKRSAGHSRPLGGAGMDFSCYLRRPLVGDGAGIHRLIAGCPPLDANSMYCNLLQCTHFADTCVVAEVESEVAAFLSAYRKPDDLQVMFVWQIAVAESFRGRGLASRMLHELMRRPAARQVNYLETSITPSNRASFILFERFAQKHAATSTKSILFSKAGHFADRHEDEVLFRIGPFPPQYLSQ
jgi:L-2,4-diaminobutyric acid acetyltransferase